MNIDNGTSEDLKVGVEVLLKGPAIITEVGSNYIEVEFSNGDTLTISESADWFIEL